MRFDHRTDTEAAGQRMSAGASRSRDPANAGASARHLPDLLGIELCTVEPDAVTARLVIRAELSAPTGFLHAASLVALADTACGFGTLATLPDGAAGFTTVELKSNFLATAREGVLECQARKRHGGRTTQIWDAEVSCQERPLALFRCTQLILGGGSRDPIANQGSVS